MRGLYRPLMSSPQEQWKRIWSGASSYLWMGAILAFLGVAHILEDVMSDHPVGWFAPAQFVAGLAIVALEIKDRRARKKDRPTS